MLALLIFVVTTILLFIGRYFVTMPASNIKIMYAAYVTIILISQLYFNYSLLTTFCKGNNDFTQVILATLIPWIVIFGSIQGALVIFPSWKRPFSNTFGYLVSKLAGVNELLFKLLKSPNTGGIKLKKTLHNIYSDPSLFINEITPTNFSDFVKNSTFLFVPNAARMPEMKQFFNIIRLKDLVSEFVWYILSGILVTTVSYNAIASTNCSNSVAEMKKRHDEYEIEVKEKQEQEKKAPPKRVYYIRD